MLKNSYRTLIVGGEYAEIEGIPHVSERLLSMLRIFSDNISSKVFALRKIESDDKKLYSTLFPYEVVPISSPKTQRSWEVINPVVDWDFTWHCDILKKVDAVYCRFPSCYWDGYHIYRLALEQKKLVFSSLHGDWAGVYRHLADNSIPTRRVSYRIAAYLAHNVFKQVARTSRVLFCVGPRIKEKYGRVAEKPVVFANYLHKNSDIFRREDTCQGGIIRFVYVGAFSLRKGVEHLLSVFARLRNDGIPGILSLVGKGEEEENLKIYARKLNIEDHIEWHGYVPFGLQLFEKYRESDIFVLPSLVGEGAPKVIVEAMSQGLPVVATDVGSTAQMIRDSNGGILVSPGNDESLYKSLLEIINNGSLRKKIISEGLDFASKMTNEKQRCIVRDAFVERLGEVMPTTIDC